MNKTLLTAALVIAGASLFAGDVLRFRGENSQGMFSEEKGLMKSWPQGGLTPKWTYTGLGEGWSSVIKVGNFLYTTGSDMTSKPKMEKVACLDLDGKLMGVCSAATVIRPSCKATDSWQSPATTGDAYCTS